MSWPSCCARGLDGGGMMTKEEGWVGGKKFVRFVGEYSEVGLPKDRFDDGGSGIS